jgi:hypothetical protein
MKLIIPTTIQTLHKDTLLKINDVEMYYKTNGENIRVPKVQKGTYKI